MYCASNGMRRCGDRYRRLAECKPLMQVSDEVVQGFYSKFFPKFFAASPEPQTVEWVLLFDNSRSMMRCVEVPWGVGSRGTSIKLRSSLSRVVLVVICAHARVELRPPAGTRLGYWRRWCSPSKRCVGWSAGLP